MPKTQVDFKLSRIYRNSGDAERDVSRLRERAVETLESVNNALLGRALEDGASVQFRHISREEFGEKEPGKDYQSVIFERGGKQTEYAIDDAGDLEKSYGATELDPDGYEDEPPEFEPLYDDDGKRDSARRYVNVETGETISRREFMRIQDEIDNREYDDYDDGIEVIISYGRGTN